LLLRDLNFSTIPRPDTEGIPTSYPTHVSRGELFDLARVPEIYRKSLREGEDFRTAWTYEELEEIRRAQENIYAQQLEAEPVIENR
jgi:hypothetical protein